jgi:hypothetical protein
VRLVLRAPHQVYRAADGGRLTGVTTYCGALDKPPLRNWTGVEEREGILRFMGGEAWTAATLRSVLPKTKDGKPLLFADAKRDKAADLGTITHFRCSAWLKGEEAEPDGIPPDLWSESQHGLDRFVAEWNERGLELLHSELVIIYEDAGMRYGGTTDIVAINPAMQAGVVDLKTSKASPWWPYDEVYAQVEAYARGVEKKLGVKVEWTEAWRIGKTPGDELQTKPFSAKERELGWRMFSGAYEAYEAKRALEKARR